MRKLIWLALAVGTADLMKREALKRGITIPAMLTNVLRNIMTRFAGIDSAQKA